MSVAMVAGLVLVLLDEMGAAWLLGQRIAFAVFLALLIPFVGRMIWRRLHGQSWDEARGLEPWGT